MGKAPHPCPLPRGEGGKRGAGEPLCVSSIRQGNDSRHAWHIADHTGGVPFARQIFRQSLKAQFF
jgi:hypothetical protein